MQYLLRSTKQEELQLQRRWQSYFTVCGEKQPSPKNSKMRQLSIYSNGKGISSCVIICLLSIAGKVLARVLLNRLNEHLEQSGLLPESSVESERTEEQFTWLLQQGSFKRNARNRTWTSTWPLLTLPRHLIQSVVRVFGKLYACTGPKWWWVFWSIPCDKWCQARMCTSPNSVQMMFSAILIAAF